MPIQILMPEGAGDATIARWTRRPGDAVRRDEVLLEIETDKAMLEVEATGDGVLAAILAAEGSKGLPAGTVLGLIATAGEDPPGPAADAPQTGPRVAASPLARRLAQQANIDLAGLRGSGPHGRIVKVDLERAPASPAPAARLASTEPATAPPPPAGARIVPHTPMRRVIAQRLSQAKRTIPHFYLSLDCDVDALLALRRQLDAQAGFKPSVNDFVLRAVALAMQRVPAVNASWGDEGLRLHASVDVSVAVATPTGLMTPIVRQADSKPLAALHAEVKTLAARARDGRLRPDEYQGGGFTISNLGMHGIREFFAIVNPPQAAILAVGACEQRPVVREGALAVGTRMTCSLSADHRVVDGAVGAEFLATVRGLLEAPLALLV